MARGNGARGGARSSAISQIRIQNRPHPRHRAVLTAIAVDLARSGLDDCSVPSPREAIACLTAYLDAHERRGAGRRCVGWGAALVGRQREYCSDRCKKAHVPATTGPIHPLSGEETPHHPPPRRSQTALGSDRPTLID
jgi:hypothetical protein